MARTLDASMLTDISAQSAEEIQFIELQFSGATTRICTGAKDVLWNGLTWEAVGGKLDIEGFSESSEDDSNGMRMTLSGVNQAILAQVLGQNFRGRPGKVWHGHLDKTTGQVVGGATGPVLMFDGRMNEAWDINEAHGDYGAGEVNIGTRLAARISEFSKIRGIRTNMTSHRNSGIPGVTIDTFMQNVGALVNQKIYWGSLAPGQHNPSVPAPPNGIGGIPNGPKAEIPGPHGVGGSTPGSSTPGIGGGDTHAWGGGGAGIGGTTPGQQSQTPPSHVGTSVPHGIGGATPGGH